MDIREVRLQQLLVLLQEEGGKRAKLAARLRKSPSQLSQWLGRHRTITEDSAREIEAKAGKSQGWLDQAATPTPAAGRAAVSATTSVLVAPPLDQALPVVLDALAAAPERGKLRTALLAVLDDDAPAYRQRLAELLRPAAPSAAQGLLTKTAQFETCDVIAPAPAEPKA